MSENWEDQKLLDACEVYQPKTITSKEIMQEGKYSVFGANGQIGFYDKYNHEHSEVLLTCRGATCGTINWSLPKSWITGNSMVVHPKHSRKLNKRFLYFLLSHQDFGAVISGSAQPQITRQSLSSMKISVPKLPVQRRIVDLIEALNAVQNSANDTVSALEILRSSLLDNLLSGAHEIPASYDTLLEAA